PGQDRVRRPIALEHAVRYQPVRSSLRLDLRVRLAEGKRLSLREDVRHQYVVMTAHRIQWLAERDEVAWNEAGPLMDQLIEGVLTVGSRLAEVDRTSLIRHASPVEHDLFAIALHRQLPQIGWETLEVLFVRQHGDCRRAEKVVIPDR